MGNADDTYVFIMKWQCNEYEASCDDIVLISDELLPNTCSNECVDNIEKQESESNQGREIDDDEWNMDGYATRSVGFTIAVVIGAVLVVVGIIVFAHMRRRKKAMEQNTAAVIAVDKKSKNKVDDKYQPFVSENEQNFNVVHIEDVQEMPNNTVQLWSRNCLDL